MMRILDIIKKNKFYQKLIEGYPTRTLPVLSKRDYERAINYFKNQHKFTHQFWQGVYWSPSGGSTSIKSKYFYFPWDANECYLQRKMMSQALIDGNVGIFKEKYLMANLFQGGNIYRSLELFQQLAENAGITSLPIGENTDNNLLDEFMFNFQPNLLGGSPAVLAKYGLYCIEKKLNFNVKAVLYSCNKLYPIQENIINNAFAKPHIYSIYGSAETGPWAFCNGALFERNQFIIAKDIVDVEVINKDENGFGEVVVTIKIRRRFPVVRFAIGDIGRLKELTINDKQYLLLELQGRASQWLSYSDCQVELRKIEQKLAKYLEWQIIQGFERNNNIEYLEFRLVPGVAKHTENINEELCSLLNINPEGDLIKIKVTFVKAEHMIRARLSNKIIRIIDNRNN
jgi:phenylacetate-coenzyme A ligase PaaK-like adenylate-forming protein